MKYHTIVHTQFLEDICEALTFSAYNIGFKQLTVTAEWLSANMQNAFEIIQKNLDRINEEVCHYQDDDDWPIDTRQEIEAEDRLLTDLGILQDLEGADYATPGHMASSIETLSAKLSEQLQAKALDEYYTKKLAEVLSELCELIKEV